MRAELISRRTALVIVGLQVVALLMVLSRGHAQPAGPASTAPGAAPGTASAASAGKLGGKLLKADGAPPRHGVVYLEGVPAASWTPPKEHPGISQRGARFSPDFLVVAVGQTVDMPNDDRIVHNVFSISPTKKFDLGHYGQGESRSVRFEKAGIVEVYCNIHENMQAVIVVAPSTFFAVTGADGTFAFAGAPPPGSYQLVGYSPEAGEVRVPVVLKAGEPVTVNLNLKAR